MNRRELIRAVAAQTAHDVKQVESVVSGLTDVITAIVAKGEAVTVQGFAKFAKVERAARMGRNPRTGEQIRIKASKRVRVSPMKAFKDTVMSGQGPRLASGVYPTSQELLAKQASERKEAARAAAPAKRTAGTTKSTAKKSTAKKSTAKKSTTKRAAAKRGGATKTTARKSAARKSTARKSPARKSTAKKTTARKSVARRPATKRSTATRRPATKKTASRRTTGAKKTARKRTARR